MEPFVLLQIAGEPAHGYEIAQAVAALGFRRAAEDPSVLYKLLRTFEEEDLAESEWAIGDSGPPRRVYRLTAKGVEYLATRAADLERQGARIALFLERYAAWNRKKGRSGSQRPRGRNNNKEKSHE
jgi:PadR family transcriptional regulator PadR